MSTYRLTFNFDQQIYAGGPGSTKKAIASQAMDQVIVNELVRQYAAAHHISVSSSDLDKEIASEQKRAGGAAKFEGQLARVHVTLDQYKALVRPELLTRAVADRLFPVPMTKVRVAHVWHILISTHPSGKKARTDTQARSLAEDILHRVRQGADFASLARQYSDDPGSAQQGGNLGSISQGQTVPQFDKASFNAPLHVPVLVHSSYGYHIVEVISRGQSTQPSQAGVQQQRQKFTAWAGQQMKKAKIKRIATVS
jgi:peptidyl-prolyl cis-trans isomerase SurA